MEDIIQKVSFDCALAMAEDMDFYFKKFFNISDFLTRHQYLLKLYCKIKKYRIEIIDISPMKWEEKICFFRGDIKLGEIIRSCGVIIKGDNQTK